MPDKYQLCIFNGV